MAQLVLEIPRRLMMTTETAAESCLSMLDICRTPVKKERRNAPFAWDICVTCTVKYALPSVCRVDDPGRPHFTSNAEHCHGFARPVWKDDQRFVLEALPRYPFPCCRERKSASHTVVQNSSFEAAAKTWRDGTTTKSSWSSFHCVLLSLVRAAERAAFYNDLCVIVVLIVMSPSLHPVWTRDPSPIALQPSGTAFAQTARPRRW